MPSTLDYQTAYAKHKACTLEDVQRAWPDWTDAQRNAVFNHPVVHRLAWRILLDRVGATTERKRAKRKARSAD